MQEQSKTGIEIKVGFFPLAFFSFLGTVTGCKAIIVIDGEECRKSWGTYFFELESGKHTVKIFFGHWILKEYGANSIDVIVEDGKANKIMSRMPLCFFTKGFLEEI